MKCRPTRSTRPLAPPSSLGVNDDLLASLGEGLPTYLTDQATKAAQREGAQTSGAWTFKRIGVEHRITTFLATCDLGGI